MIMNRDFDIVNFADEYIAVPHGEKAKCFNGVVALSETAAFLLRNMKNEEKTRDQLLQILLDNYQIDLTTANKDLDEWILSLCNLGLVDM